jgi:SAM-dependent methyltransferase
MKLELHQQGRAYMDIIGDLSRFENDEMLPAIRSRVEDMVGLAGTNNLRLAEKRELVGPLLESDPNWRLNRLIYRWVSQVKSDRSMDAFNEIREQAEEALSRIPVTSTLNSPEDVEIPDYYRDVDFHLMRGSWDGHERMGLIMEEVVYAKVNGYAGNGAVDNASTSGRESVWDQRRNVALAVKNPSPDVIVELGCGNGRTMLPFQQTFPDAHLIGVDLSQTHLEYAQIMAAENGYTWELHRARAEHSGLPDNSADVVVTYALLHEIPTESIHQVTQEAYRILKPGGELIHGDVPPYHKLDAFRTMVNDWEPENRAEPFWRAACLIDRPRILSEAGFVDVDEFAAGAKPHPWITYGTKPR